MDSVRGQVTFTVEDTTVLIHASGKPVATLTLPKGDKHRETHWVILGGGDTWTVDWTLPAFVAHLLDAGETLPTTAVSPKRIPSWASVVHDDRGIVAEAEIGVSSITLAPVTMVIHLEASVCEITAGPSWRSWSLAADGETIATIDSDDGFIIHATQPVPMAVLTLAATNGLAVASQMRPKSLPRGAREDKTEAKFLDEYHRAADMARDVGHKVQYMSAWDNRVQLYSWIECLRCGQVASTFFTVGEVSSTTMADGTTFDAKLATLLNTACTWMRPANG